MWSLPARSDSKLVIYGASGIASPAHSLSATPTHRADITPTHLFDATPTSLDVIKEDTRPNPSGYSLSHEQSTGSVNEVVRVGSVADVEHKSVSALISERRRRSSGGQSSNYDHRTSSRVSVTIEPELSHHDDQIHHQGSTEDSPWKEDPRIQTPEYRRGSYRSSTEHVHNRMGTNSPYKTSSEHLRRRMGSNSPHRSSTEHVHRISNSDGPYKSSTEHVQKRLSDGGSHRSSREFVIRRVSGDYSRRMSGEYKLSNDSLHHRQESLGKTTPTRPHTQYQNATPSALTSSARHEHSLHDSPGRQQRRDYHNNHHYPTNGSRSPPWYENTHEKQDEFNLSFRTCQPGHKLPDHINSGPKLHNKGRTYKEQELGERMWYQDERWRHATGHHGNGQQHSGDHTHQWNGHTHNKSVEPYRKMSHDQSPEPLQNGVLERKSKSRSLPRDVTPERVAEEEEEEPCRKRVIDPNHPARPKNRGPFRLSLQDSTFYDTTRQYKGGSARWPRHSTVTSFSTASLSQPSDLLGVS